jgi:hypothetical protein
MAIRAARWRRLERSISAIVEAARHTRIKQRREALLLGVDGISDLGPAQAQAQ